MNEFHTTIDCGELGEVETIIQYDYQPAEPMTYDYPGCAAEAEVTGITLQGVTLSPYLLSELIGNFDTAVLLEYEDRLAAEAQEDWDTRDV